MKEPALVLKAKKALIAEGHYAAKIHGGQYSAGIPDIVGVSKPFGIFVGLEFKVPGRERKTSALQEKNLRAIREAGGCAWVVSSVEAALEVFRDLPAPDGEYGFVYVCK